MTPDREGTFILHPSNYDKTVQIFLRFGSVGFGSVRFGSVRFGSVRFGSVRFGSVRFCYDMYRQFGSVPVRFGPVLHTRFRRN